MEGRILTKPHTLTKNYMQLVTIDKDVFNKDEPPNWLSNSKRFALKSLHIYIHTYIYVCVCIYYTHIYMHIHIYMCNTEQKILRVVFTCLYLYVKHM